MSRRETSPQKENKSAFAPVFLVRKSGYELETLVITKGVSLKKDNLDLYSVLSEMKVLQDQLDNRRKDLQRRLTVAPNIKQKHTTNPQPSRQKQQILTNLRSELGAVDRKRGLVNDGFSAVYDAAAGTSKDPKTVVLREDHKGEMEIVINPIEEKLWWGFINSDPGSEITDLLGIDPKLFTFIHNGFVKRVYQIRSRVEPRHKQTEATEVYRSFVQSVEQQSPIAKGVIQKTLTSAGEYLHKQGL